MIWTCQHWSQSSFVNLWRPSIPFALYFFYTDPSESTRKSEICLPLPSNTGILFRERNVANIRTYWKNILYELLSMKITAWTNFSPSWCGCMFLMDSSSFFFLLWRGCWEGKHTSCCLIKASSDALSVLKWKTLKESILVWGSDSFVTGESVWLSDVWSCSRTLTWRNQIRESCS